MMSVEKNWKEEANIVFCSLLEKMVEKGSSLNEEMYNHIELILVWAHRISNGVDFPTPESP